jgi:tetratricopeptide (TPR) repeat protein
MKQKVAVLYGFCLAFSIAVFSCASTGGADDASLLSLDEAIEQTAVKIAEDLPAGTRVAIAAFSSEHANLSNYIMDELNGALVDGNLEVADRRTLDYVYNELNFQMSGDVSDESAVSIGKFLGAHYVITGQLVKTGNRYRYRVSGVHVETAVQETSIRLDVRDDRAFQTMLASFRKNAPAAGYGGSATAIPRTAGAFLDRGILFATRGDYDTAIADFTEAINLDQNMVSAYILRGRALLASVSRVTAVEENFSTIWSSTDERIPVEQRQAAYDRAIADYTQAIRLDPDNARAYASRSGIYIAKGDYDRAIADCTQAIRIDANNAIAYGNRGSCYNAKGDYDRAIADCTQAIRLDPNNAIAYGNRGNAYYNKKNYDRARSDWTKALQLDPNFTLARDRLERLRREGH